MTSTEEMPSGDLKLVLEALAKVSAQTEESVSLMENIFRGVNTVKIEVQELRMDLKATQKKLEEHFLEFKNHQKVTSAEGEVVRNMQQDINRMQQYAEKQAGELEKQLDLLVKMESRSDTPQEAVQDQDRERQDQEARSRNLRITGLVESEGEDTMGEVVKFFEEVLKVYAPQIERVARVGKRDVGSRVILVKFMSLEDRAVVLGNRSQLKGHRISLDPDLTMAQAEEKRKELQKVKAAAADRWDLWRDADLVAFVETWEWGEEVSLTVPGFFQVVALRNKKKKRGRGHGGIAIWTREGLGLDVSVETIDVRKQFVGLRIRKGESDPGSIFLFITYFPPSGSLVYRAEDR
ncbi:hypothetical protein R1sor_008964 [Riccia sorocarpa]|uniref:RRM domain-containing protein n=1 Tax=Riccia sorocarpa TaxID=122646 RepID=A0ABD3H7X9_9MARC